MKRILAAVWLAVAGGASAAEVRAEWVPGELRCEHLENPLGVEAAQPRLSWKILLADSAGGATGAATIPRGVRQTAYRIRVASSGERLAAGQGDQWDSGRVESDNTVLVEYAGQPLRSGQACFWSVQFFDQDGKPSPWSEPARWEMGLLAPADWAAKWINGGGYVYRANTSGAAAVSLKILRAGYGAGGTEKDVTALVAGRVEAGGLAVLVSNDTLGGDPLYGRAKALTVEYELNGTRGKAMEREGGTVSIPPTYKPAVAGDPVPYLRKSVQLADKPVARARLYVTALGLYEMRLNGRRVGDAALAPEWTDYRKRVRYQVYDVTAMLRRGENVLGALVGAGWFCGRVGLNGHHVYGSLPALLAQLEVRYADGSVQQGVTDESWRAWGSPIRSSNFMDGEKYDARLEVAGWDAPGFDDRGWTPASVREEKRVLEAQVAEPVRKLCEIATRAVTEPAPGRWTFDLGQNMVGVARLRVEAPAGTSVTLRHAEMLNPDGTIYTANLRSAHSVDTYICKGGGVEVYEPRFTFHGFRYVEVTGLPGKPPADQITGIVIGSDTPQAGEFSCSDARINQLYSNIVWGQRGNYLSVPTDCPQRDERLGWMGDAQVFVRSATYNANVAAFFSKWMVDVDDAQRDDGAFTDVSPFAGCGAGTPAWADAGVICPWTLYTVYGDKRLLARHYPAMRRWIGWCRAHSTNLIRDRDRGGDYGDWLSIGANTPKDLIGTAYFAHSTRLVGQAAQVLGKTEDAAQCARWFEEIKAAFNKRFVAADGRIHGNTQCAYLMALKFDLLPEELRPKAVQYLVEDIAAKKDHLSTGFIGVGYLLPELTRAGRVESAYRIFLQDTFPSWLFSVKHGATTIWERWDGWTPERGFQNPGMNSFNHYSLGSCGEWMFSSLAGIDTDGPGFRKLLIRPTPPPSGFAAGTNGVAWVKASYDSISGRIASEWRAEAGALTLSLAVPPNTAATVFVPAKEAAGVTESGVPAERMKGGKFLRMEEGAAVFAVGSGAYTFVSR